MQIKQTQHNRTTKATLHKNNFYEFQNLVVPKGNRL